MIKRYFSYTALHYLKSFTILLVGMSLAIVLIDFLQHAKSIDGGANLKILYIYYKWQSILLLIYPIVMVFSFIATQMSFVKNNTLVALFALGYGRRRLLRPFLAVSALIYLLFLGLQFTSFSYGEDMAKSLVDEKYGKRNVDELFFKYDDSFVYVRRLNPAKKELYGVVIFDVDGGRVKKIVSFDKARFENGSWMTGKVRIDSKRYDESGKLSGFDTVYDSGVRLLEGYEPNVVKSIYEGRSSTLAEGFSAWVLLKSQGLDMDKIKSTIYNKILMPLFAFPMIVLLFLSIPIHQRFIRSEMVWALSLGSTLFVWGFLYALFRLSVNGVVPPDLAQTVPVALLSLFAVYRYLKSI
jgi:lipopolysaccharide export system permease protein